MADADRVIETASSSSLADPKGTVARLEDMSSLLFQLFAETVGTLIIVFVTGTAIIMCEFPWSGVAFAFVVTVVPYALSTASFLHFNPAVTVAAVLTCKLHWVHGILYMMVQVLSACLAGLALTQLFSKYISMKLPDGYLWWQVGLLEGLYSGFFVFVHLNCVHSRKHAGRSQFFGLALGAAALAAQLAGAPISAGLLNPALVLGFDLPVRALGQPSMPTTLFYYAGCQMLGGIAAVPFFLLVRPKEVFGPTCQSSRSSVPLFSKLLAELVGTAGFAFTFCLCLEAGAQSVWGVVAILIAMSFALGSVSGAHFNPTVTLAVLLSCRGGIVWLEAWPYIVSQCAGAVLGCFGQRLLISKELGTEEPFSLLPVDSTYDLEGMVASEFAFTFVLAFVVSATTAVGKDHRLAEYFGLAHGMCMALGVLVVRQVSGGWLNPAMALGITLMDGFNGSVRREFFYYLGAYAAAALCAAAALICAKPSEFIAAGRQSEGDRSSQGELPDYISQRRSNVLGRVATHSHEGDPDGGPVVAADEVVHEAKAKECSVAEPALVQALPMITPVKKPQPLEPQQECSAAEPALMQALPMIAPIKKPQPWDQPQDSSGAARPPSRSVRPDQVLLRVGDSSDGEEDGEAHPRGSDDDEDEAKAVVTAPPSPRSEKSAATTSTAVARPRKKIRA